MSERTPCRRLTLHSQQIAYSARIFGPSTECEAPATDTILTATMDLPIRDPHYACKTCGCTRNCMAHLRAEFPPEAAKKYLRRHCPLDKRLASLCILPDSP